MAYVKEIEMLLQEVSPPLICGLRNAINLHWDGKRNLISCQRETMMMVMMMIFFVQFKVSKTGNDGVKKRRPYI